MSLQIRPICLLLCNSPAHTTCDVIVSNTLCHKCQFDIYYFEMLFHEFPNWDLTSGCFSFVKHTTAPVWEPLVTSYIWLLCYVVAGGPVSPVRQESLLELVRDKKPGGASSSAARSGSWKTRVLIGVNVNKCEIKVNMGNLMGNSL